MDIYIVDVTLNKTSNETRRINSPFGLWTGDIWLTGLSPLDPVFMGYIWGITHCHEAPKDPNVEGEKLSKILRSLEGLRHFEIRKSPPLHRGLPEGHISASYMHNVSHFLIHLLELNHPDNCILENFYFTMPLFRRLIFPNSFMSGLEKLTYTEYGHYVFRCVDIVLTMMMVHRGIITHYNGSFSLYKHFWFYIAAIDNKMGFVPSTDSRVIRSAWFDRYNGHPLFGDSPSWDAIRGGRCPFTALLDLWLSEYRPLYLLTSLAYCFLHCSLSTGIYEVSTEQVFLASLRFICLKRLSCLANSVNDRTNRYYITIDDWMQWLAESELRAGPWLMDIIRRHMKDHSTDNGRYNPDLISTFTPTPSPSSSPEPNQVTSGDEQEAQQMATTEQQEIQQTAKEIEHQVMQATMEKELFGLEYDYEPTLSEMWAEVEANTC